MFLFTRKNIKPKQNWDPDKYPNTWNTLSISNILIICSFEITIYLKMIFVNRIFIFWNIYIVKNCISQKLFYSNICILNYLILLFDNPNYFELSKKRRSETELDLIFLDINQSSFFTHTEQKLKEPKLFLTWIFKYLNSA